MRTRHMIPLLPPVLRLSSSSTQEQFEPHRRLSHSQPTAPAEPIKNTIPRPPSEPKGNYLCDPSRRRIEAGALWQFSLRGPPGDLLRAAAAGRASLGAPISPRRDAHTAALLRSASFAPRFGPLDYENHRRVRLRLLLLRLVQAERRSVIHTRSGPRLLGQPTRERQRPPRPPRS